MKNPNRIRSTAALVAGLGSLSLLFAGAASAQPPMASSEPMTVHGGVYSVDSYHTQVLFKLSHLGLSNYFGDFSGATGLLEIDPHTMGATHLEVTIPIATVHTTSTHLDGELKTPDWFDATAFPTATFRSRHVEATGADRADIMGELTLHGVTKPVTLHAKFVGAGPNPISKAYTIGFEATGHFSRTAFGVSKYAPMVGDEVELMINAAFERKLP